METQTIITIIIAFAIAIIVFYALREVFCWYWKINALIANQRLTNDLLQKIYIQLGGKQEEIPKNDFSHLKDMDDIIIQNIETKETEQMTYGNWKEKVYMHNYDKSHKIIEVARRNAW